MNRFVQVAVFVLMTGCKACGGNVPVETTVARPVPVPVPTTTDTVRTGTYAFKRVHFKFDSTEPTSATMTAIRDNVAIMQEFPDLRIEIQGHADERGTTEYNLALGERRAYAVRDQMTRMGVSASRITVVSYGEEKPIVRGDTEEAFGQNRRAEFRVLTGEDVQGTVN